jgi:hypothetical protein
MATRPRRGLDEPQLEGTSTGGGGAGISGTKYSNMPSFKGNASIMDDLKKLTKDTSKLKGGAKKATELATDRAINRLAVRATGAAGAGAAAKTLGGKDAVADDKSKESDDYEDMSGAVDIDVSNPTGVAGRGMASGGMTASSRGDGCAQRGKTRGTVI